MRKVLIVDDERAVHLAIRALADWEGLRLEPPRSAYNGAEALALMAAYRPAIVFVDMTMPVMGGVDFLAEATRRFPEAQYIIVSGYDSFDYARAGLRYNAVDYLLKPVDVNELNRALRKALSRLPAQPEEGRTPDEIADDVKHYIDQNYARGIGLDTLAEQFHFSREYIGRVFRARFDCAVYEYIQRLRMDRAMALLKDPGLTLQDIAERLGYTNANYFSKAFRRHFGKSPSACRGPEQERENSL